MTKLTNEKIPYFNAPIYLQNKTQIGKVDEIFGPINESVSFFILLVQVLIFCCLYSKVEIFEGKDTRFPILRQVPIEDYVLVHLDVARNSVIGLKCFCFPFLICSSFRLNFWWERCVLGVIAVIGCWNFVVLDDHSLENKIFKHI